MRGSAGGVVDKSPQLVANQFLADKADYPQEELRNQHRATSANQTFAINSSSPRPGERGHPIGGHGNNPTAHNQVQFNNRDGQQITAPQNTSQIENLSDCVISKNMQARQ